MIRLLLILLLVSAGCQMKDKLVLIKETDQVGPNSSTELTEVWSKLEINTEKRELEESEESLFGKFYNDRIEFHIIDDPGIHLHGAAVDRITLYYIDSVLCKKKYEIDRGIADELALRYGAVSYKSLNHETDSLAMSMGIVLPSESGNRFNPYLKKYQLKWTLVDKTILFQHLQDTDQVANIYIEELAEYRMLYKSVQKELL